jgi:hypothetical protein
MLKNVSTSHSKCAISLSPLAIYLIMNPTMTSSLFLLSYIFIFAHHNIWCIVDKVVRAMWSSEDRFFLYFFHMYILGISQRGEYDIKERVAIFFEKIYVPVIFWRQIINELHIFSNSCVLALAWHMYVSTSSPFVVFNRKISHTYPKIKSNFVFCFQTCTLLRTTTMKCNKTLCFHL